jgi:hypothetical protein
MLNDRAPICSKIFRCVCFGESFGDLTRPAHVLSLTRTVQRHPVIGTRNGLQYSGKSCRPPSPHVFGVSPMQMFACCYPSFAVVTVYYIWHAFVQSPLGEYTFGDWRADSVLLQRAAEAQRCSHCRSPNTGYAGTVGPRQVWRCSDCSRTFWLTKQPRNVFLRLGAFLVGAGD